MCGGHRAPWSCDLQTLTLALGVASLPRQGSGCAAVETEESAEAFIAFELERLLDPLVAPVRVLRGNPDDPIADNLNDAWSADSLLLVGPLRRDQPPVSSEDRVQRDDRRGLRYVSARSLSLVLTLSRKERARPSRRA